MQSSMDRQKLIRNGLAAGVVLAGMGLALGYVRHLTRVDPFVKFNKSGSAAERLATMKDVDMRQYHGGELVGSAHVGELGMRSDRQTFDLNNVVDGVIYTKDGRLEFTAPKATWNASSLQLAVDDGGTVSNKDFDLRAPSFSVDQNQGVINVPKEIRGRFFGGRISAGSLVYNMRTGMGRTGAVTWVGKPNLQQEEVSTPTKWTFQSAGATFHKGEMETWENARATDGEVIVQGDKIERNTKTDVITATGNCLYFSAKSDLACDKVVVYRKEKRAVLSGNVRMLIKPKDEMTREVKVNEGEIPPFRPVVPESVAATGNALNESPDEKKLDEEVRSGETTRKYPTAVLATNVEYWYGKGKRRAIVTGSPQASQQLAGSRWRKAWANKVLYDGEAETLRMVSTEGKKDVRMKTSIGDDLTASWFEFSTKEGDDSWKGFGMSGDVMADDEDLPKSDKPAPADTGAKPETPPTTPPTKDPNPPAPSGGGTTGGG